MREITKKYHLYFFIISHHEERSMEERDTKSEFMEAVGFYLRYIFKTCLERF